MQSVASAILAPSLRLVADRLALEWRKQLTRRAHQKYLAASTFYSVSQLAGMQVKHFQIGKVTKIDRHRQCPVHLTPWVMPACSQSTEHLKHYRHCPAN